MISAERRHGTLLVSRQQRLFVQILLAEVRLPAIVASRMGPHIAKTQIAARVCVQSMCTVAQPSGMFSVCRKFFNSANRFHALAAVAVRRLLVLSFTLCPDVLQPHVAIRFATVIHSAVV